MRVVVTGGAGFIGYHTCVRLSELDHEVVAVDCASQPESEVRAEALEKLGIHVVRDDHVVAFADFLRDGHAFDAAVHLSGLTDVRESFEHSGAYMQGNVEDTVEIVNRARKMVSRFIFASSGGSVYASGNNHHESEALAPSSPYGVSKAAAEMYVALSAPNPVSLRFGNVYGPGSTRGLVAASARAALSGGHVSIHGDGNQTRCWIHVRDAVESIVLAASHGPPGVYNIGDQQEVSAMEVVSKVLLAAGSSRSVMDVVSYDLISHPGPMRSSLNCKRAMADLRWMRGVDLEDGIKETVEWWRERLAS